MKVSNTSESTFVYDIIAGLTVSFAALSLGAAFGTMSGRGAFAGMIGAAVIPIITSIFGGTRLQASGPTAPIHTICTPGDHPWIYEWNWITDMV